MYSKAEGIAYDRAKQVSHAAGLRHSSKGSAGARQ